MAHIQKTKIMASSPITPWQIDRETMEKVTDFILLASKITADGDCSYEIKMLAPWKKSYDLSQTSNEYSGLISFRMDWLDLLAVQGTLNSLIQHHSSKASILRLSAFFIVQLSYPYMTTGKTIALTRWIFVSKVISLLFNTV